MKIKKTIKDWWNILKASWDDENHWKNREYDINQFEKVIEERMGFLKENVEYDEKNEE